VSFSVSVTLPLKPTPHVCYVLRAVAASIPTIEPSEIIIGETVKWSIGDSDYSPADGWALQYLLRGPASGTGKGLDLTESNCIDARDSDWLMTIPATETGDPLPPATDQLVAGDYYWERWVTKAAETYRRGAGKIIVKQSLSAITTSTAYDGRSEVKQTLDAIRAAIAGRATAAQQERTIDNTTIRFMTIPDLMIAETKWQQLYNQEVRRARAARGESPFRTIRTRFVPPQ
jgi:hypothetical protein